MPRQQVTRALPWALSGALYGLSFPPFDLSYLAWIALVPFLWAASRPDLRPKDVARGAFGTGLLANLIVFNWLWSTFRAAQIDTGLTLLCWFLMSAILALYFCAFAFFYRSQPGAAGRVWLSAAAWVALDEIRSVILTGFPWGLLSHTQAANTALIQISAFTGAAGVTFVLVAVNAAIVEALRGRRAQLAAASGLTLLLLVGGTVRLNRADALEYRTMVVSVLQGNIDQYRKWDDAYEADIRAAYSTLALRAGKQNPDLIVWPESSVPAWIPTEEKYVQWLAWISSRTAAPHLFGSLSQHGRREHNSAFVMHPDGRLEGQYNKRHLVPFGEYVPLERILKRVVPYLGMVGVFDAGDSAKVFEIDGIRLTPNICYESMFPALVRDSARGADVIVNLTNDGWFPSSAAPSQHFVVNIFRAVENGRPVIRAANTGISAFIDAFGRVRFASALMIMGTFTDRLPIPPFDFRTFYGKTGNWFGGTCVAFAIGSAGFLLYRRRRGTP